jgi:hypothetical protein
MSTRVRRAGKLENLPATVDAGLRKGLHTSGVRIASRAKRIFELFRPKGTATGATVRSITVGRVRAIGNMYRVAVGPGTHQAQFLHAKTPPQRPPPLKNIVEWLKVKPGTPPRDALYAVAKAVQKKIALKGTEAFPFMTTALKIEKNEVVGIIYKSVVKELLK